MTDQEEIDMTTMITTLAGSFALQNALMGIRFFDGKNIPLNDFIQDLKHGEVFVGNQEDMYVKAILGRLTGAARDSTYGKKFNNLNELIQHLKKRFAPGKDYSYYAKKINAIQMRRGDSVGDFYDHINILINGARSVMEEEIPRVVRETAESRQEKLNLALKPLMMTALDQFIRGLPVDIAKAVDMKEPKTLEEAYQAAVRMESRMYQNILPDTRDQFSRSQTRNLERSKYPEEEVEWQDQEMNCRRINGQFHHEYMDNQESSYRQEEIFRIDEKWNGQQFYDNGDQSYRGYNQFIDDFHHESPYNYRCPNDDKIGQYEPINLWNHNGENVFDDNSYPNNSQNLSYNEYNWKHFYGSNNERQYHNTCSSDEEIDEEQCWNEQNSDEENFYGQNYVEQNFDRENYYMQPFDQRIRNYTEQDNPISNSKRQNDPNQIFGPGKDHYQQNNGQNFSGPNYGLEQNQGFNAQYRKQNWRDNTDRRQQFNQQLDPQNMQTQYHQTLNLRVARHE